MNSASGSAGTAKHIPELDGIRGLAILMVLAWHYYCGQLPKGLTESGVTGFVFRALSTSWSGVDLFFVLSGFLIGGILIDNRNAGHLYKAFYIRRACRILPAYILLMTAYFVLRPLLDPTQSTWLFRHAMPDYSYLTFTQNIFMGMEESFGASFLAATWSLAVEEQFYLFLPFLLFLLGYRRWVLLLPVLVVGAILLRMLFPGFQTFVNMPFRMDSLILGVILAVMVRHATCVQLLREHRICLRLLAWTLLAAWALATARKPELGIFKESFFSVVYAVFILVILLEAGSNWCAPLRSRFLRFCGRISYGLYLYHLAVTGLLYRFILHSPKPIMSQPLAPVVMLLSVAVTFALAFLSYRLVEQRILHWGHRFQYTTPPV